MCNSETGELFTLDKIKSLYKPAEETFKAKDGMDISAQVRRNEKGQIVYVTPGSVRDLTAKPSA